MTFSIQYCAMSSILNRRLLYRGRVLLKNTHCIGNYYKISHGKLLYSELLYRQFFTNLRVNKKAFQNLSFAIDFKLEVPIYKINTHNISSVRS